MFCLGIGLFPQWQVSTDPETGDKVSEFRLGLWFSPVHETARRDAPQGGFRRTGKTNLLSWSFLLLAAGTVGLQVFWARKRMLIPQSKPGPKA